MNLNLITRSQTMALFVLSQGLGWLGSYNINQADLKLKEISNFDSFLYFCLFLKEGLIT